MEPAFSIVIPAFNNRHVLELLLRCVEAQSLPREQFECVVVNDGSKDATSSFLESYRPSFNLHCLSHPTNRGRSAARNTACSQAKGDFLIFLDADMLPEPDWLAGYAQALAQSPALDVVSGGRYHLHLGANASDRPQKLAQRLGVSAEKLFVTQVVEQFKYLRANTRQGMYPGYAMAKIEAQLPEICQKYPKSILCAYSVITSIDAAY